MFSDLSWELSNIPVFRPKRPKTLPFEATHTYMAYIREYPIGGSPRVEAILDYP